LADRRQAALVEEALHALALHLGGVDVTLAVDGDVVEVLELTRPTPHAPEAATIKAAAGLSIRFQVASKADAA
jgi:hypothetical protein